MHRTIAILTAGLCSVVSSFPANVASGKLWRVPEAIAQNAIPANVPATTPDVTFDVFSPFNFNVSGPSPISTFLASSAAFNIVENTAGALAQLTDDFVLGTLIEFTGNVTVANGQQFSVTHDDGLTLIIGGIDLNFNPGPTPPVQSIATYNGPSGTFPFQLVYDECCGGPAVLQVDLPFVATPTPDGGSMLALLGLGVAGLGVVSRRAGRR
jgi:hypothetical protein